MLHTAVFAHEFPISTVGARIVRPLGCDIRVPPSNVPGNNLPVGADAFIGPRRVSGLTRRVRRLRKTGYTVAPPASPALCATSPQGEAWAGVFGGGAFAVQASGPMWASAPTRERRQRSGFDKMDKIPPGALTVGADCSIILSLEYLTV